MASHGGALTLTLGDRADRVVGAHSRGFKGDWAVVAAVTAAAVVVVVGRETTEEKERKTKSRSLGWTLLMIPCKVDSTGLRRFTGMWIGVKQSNRPVVLMLVR